jgi:hypothetical protein
MHSTAPNETRMDGLFMANPRDLLTILLLTILK